MSANPNPPDAPHVQRLAELAARGAREAEAAAGRFPEDPGTADFLHAFADRMTQLADRARTGGVRSWDGGETLDGVNRWWGDWDDGDGRLAALRDTVATLSRHHLETFR